MAELIKGTACVMMAAIVAGLVVVGLQTPMPADSSIGDQIVRTLRAGLAELEIRLLPGEARLDGGRELIELDPSLNDPVGRRGASIVLAESNDTAERRAIVERAFVASGYSSADKFDLLRQFLGAGSLDAPRLTRALELAAALDDPSHRVAATARVVDAAITTGHPDSLRAAAVAVAQLQGEAATKTAFAMSVIDLAVADLLDDVMLLAADIAPQDRAALSLEMLGAPFADAVDDRNALTSAAIAMDRNALTLNARAVQLEDPDEAFALLAEAHALDPTSVVVAANFADLAKRDAIRRHDFSVDLVQLDALLDAGLALRPDVTSWQVAREMTTINRSCGCSC